MAKSHAAYERKQAAKAAAYQPHATSLRSITMRECKLGTSERRVRRRKTTRADRLYAIAKLHKLDDVARLIARK